MNTKSTTKLSDLKLEGITITGDIRDNGIKRIVLSDTKGGVVEICGGSIYDTLTVAIPAPPKLVKTFRLHGTVMNLPVDERFNRADAAKRRREGFIDTIIGGESAVKLDIEEIEVPEEDAPKDDEIPF